MDIIKDCSANLAISSENVACLENIIKYFTGIVVGKSGEYPTCANGEFPTLAEMQAYLTAGNGYYMPITNAVKPAATLTEFTGADTYEGRTVIAQQIESFTATFRNVSNQFRVMARANNLNNQNGQLWIIAKMESGSYIIIGGATGFENVNVFIPEWEHVGYGTQGAFITKTYTWETKQALVDLFSSEDAYNALVNLVTVGLYTFGIEIGTSQDSYDVTSFSKVIGWNKNTYPILYFLVAADGVTLQAYPSDATRTGALPANRLFTIDTSVNDNVIPGLLGTSFGGNIDKSVNPFALTIADKFTVIYSAY